MWFGKRGLVAKISDGYCIILTGRGTYERIPAPPRGARVGAEVSYSSHTAIAPVLKPMALVASLLIMFVCWSLFSQVGMPVAVAYVSLDINPSLELSVDKNLNVIDVKYFNDDAANLLNQERLKGTNLYDALATVVNQAIAANYIKTGQDNLIVSTITPAGAATAPVDQQSIQQYLEKSINKGGLTGEVRMYSASGEFRAEAENEGLSPGKYLIYEQLKETGDQVSIDDVRNNNIRELVDTYKLSLLPNYKNIRIQRRQKGEEPDVTVDDNGRSVSIADFFKEHGDGGAAPSQEANAVNGRGVQPKRSVKVVRPKRNVTVRYLNNKQDDSKTQQKNGGTNARKRGRRATGSPISISTDGITWDPWGLQQSP